MSNINFNYIDEFNEYANEHNIYIDGKSVIFSGKIMEEARLNALYNPNTNEININLSAYKDDKNIVERISRTIQHELIHDCIAKAKVARKATNKGEELIVSYMVDYDYGLDYLY